MKISIHGDKAEIIEGKDEIINSGGIDYYEVKVEFDETWNDLTKYAILVKKDDSTTKRINIIDNKFYINTKNSGMHYIGFLGFKLNEKGEKIYQIPTNLVSKRLIQSAGSFDEEESDVPSASEWELYIAQIQDIIAGISSIPKGGTTGQVLTKLSNNDEDADWQEEKDPTVPAHVKAIKQEDISNWNNKAEKGNIPTKVSELENDSEFINKSITNLVNYYLKTETYNKTEVNQLVNAITTINIQIVSSLPTTGQSNIIYLVAKTDSEENDYYDEYLYINNKWEHIGSTKVDLTGYAKETWVNQQISSFLTQSEIEELINKSITELLNQINNKYTKPNEGIPKTDLEISVQSSLGKADSALQEHQKLKTINEQSLVGNGNIAIEVNPLIQGYYMSEEDLLENETSEGNYIVNYSENYNPSWVIRSLSAIYTTDDISQDRYTMLDEKNKNDFNFLSGKRYVFLDSNFTDRIVCKNSALLKTCNGLTISASGNTIRIGYRIYNKNTYEYYGDVSPVSAAGTNNPSYTINLETIGANLPSGVTIDDCLLNLIAIKTDGDISNVQDILQYLTLNLSQATSISNNNDYIVKYDGTAVTKLCKVSNINFNSSSGKLFNQYGKQSGKHVHIYRFGGKGNDWCFVRTPPSYDPNREEPFPFIICNHGNGWVMDGTEALANWTKRTMYVPLNDPDYISNPEQYNGTSDSSLWYSNPTIEHFLSNGYIVCGCENFGDGLFGNNDCRNACVDFYYHMINNYNVSKRCFMIGASNGAMTSLNASYLLGDKVAAMILQYPLTCLWNQYINYANHQASIRTAYGITDTNIDEAGFKSATRTHDPLYVNVISNTKLGYLPPIKFYWSSTDTVTVSSYNSQALMDLLENSNMIYESVQIDTSGETMAHGDYRHFEPQQYYNWFEKYR